MHEILFRGKRVDNGEWVEGFYACVLDTHYIITGRFDSLTNGIINSEAYKVDPLDCGQFTGLTDRNGVKIFEGDIIKHTQVYLHGKVKSFGYVKWSTAYACWLAGGYTNGRADMFLGDQSYKLEVLGNIYDNPELLEVSRNE